MPIYLGNQNVLLRNGGGGSGNTNSVALTQAEYDALTTEEKNNGTIYFITNGVPDNLIVNDSVPIGAIQAYAGTTTPTGWLICDGSAVSRTTYSELFEAIGTTYGAGDESTTFNLPDLRGRTAIGAGTGTATDATAHTLGSKNGTETVTLTASQSGVPQHTHALGSSGSVYLAGNAAEWPGESGHAQNYKDAIALSSLATANNTAKDATSAHSNMQPYIVIYYIIKAKNNSPTETATLSMLDMFYPVGSYYETSDSTFNPNTSWGGTWSLEAEGLVHIGAGTNYTIGNTGGEKTHTLTVNEMPSHNGHVNAAVGYGTAAGLYLASTNMSSYGSTGRGWDATNGNEIVPHTENRGGGQAHNNMQPYVVVNRWHRTA